MDALPCETAGAIKQPVARGRPAETAARGAKIFHIVRRRYGLVPGGYREGYREGTALDAGGAAVDFEARDYPGVLPIVTGLAAAEPALGLDAANERRCGFDEVGREVIVLPAVAAVGSEIEAGPALQRRRMRGALAYIAG